MKIHFRMKKIPEYLKNKKGNRTSGFNIGTTFGLTLMALVGVGLITFAYICFGNETNVDSILLEMLRFAGETLIGTAVLSAVVEMHSIKKNYEKVRDYLLLEEPSFVERYNEDEVDKIIDLAIKQKIRLKSSRNLDKENFEWLVAGDKFLLEPYIDYTAKMLGEKGFYCKSHRRQINVMPVKDNHYKIHITVEMELSNFTEELISETQVYKFYYISQKQIDSFKLCSFEMNGEERRIEELKLTTYSNDKPSTNRHPFNYFVEFKIPFIMEAGGKVHYILDYEYCNYEQSCFLTYSPPYITKSFQETYSLVGINSSKYQIHASAYTPYKNSINSRSLVQRLNDTTLSINSDNWMVPGSGFVSVIRKKMLDQENEKKCSGADLKVCDRNSNNV